MSNSEHERRTSGRRKRWPVAVGVVALLAAAVGGLSIYGYAQLTSARDDLNLASADAGQLKKALLAGDQATASVLLTRMQVKVGSARASLDSPIVSLAAKTPLIGQNVKAVRTVTNAISTVADDALPPLIEAAEGFSSKSFNPHDGAIDVDALTRLEPSLSTSSRAMTEADQEIGSIDTSSLMSQVRDRAIDAQHKIRDAATIADRAATASRIVPRLLDGRHTYLLLFQNNAEVRATGGLPGAYAELKTDHGKISIGRQGSGGSMGGLAYRATPISTEESKLFDTSLVTDFRDVGFTPDFPRAAEIATAIIAREKGIDVDGVLSLDPVTLSYLLKGTGPIQLDDGTRLTAENAVDVLLNGVYVDHPDPAVQDALFAGATKEVFATVMSGSGDPISVLQALTTATNERRVAVWAKDAAVTKEIAGTALAHELPTGESASPALGFYLNDATGAKMQYYLQSAVTGASTKCGDNGAQQYTTEMSLTSSAPADAASLPPSVQGPGFGAAPGSMLMNLYIYGPAGGNIDRVTFDGTKADSYARLTHDGRPVALVTVQVDPGQTVTVGATISSGPSQRGATVVTSTPSIVPGPSVHRWKTSC